ncbi:hypothetical protein KUF54_14000 [Comamonas sp. Y33R10-2]|uniref:hypothetical protein n=1 Tax=Comamonas sp. Y33R10-2 TaxID=2853257 RepID=UPI001C5C8F1E|nr:hypothetical protein [Comamonas sp. Y33R10-2]QXZ09125.1 hypothetical protein KUF54_14000 [Comamonas sp. Y33R10-2]
MASKYAPAHAVPFKLRRQLTLRCAAITLLVGSLGAAALLIGLAQHNQQQALAGQQAIAHSVAQTLVNQMARAARLGIPLQKLPGVEAHLQQTLNNTPQLAYIAVADTHGQPMYSASRGTAESLLTLPVVVKGQSVALIQAGARNSQVQGLLQPALACTFIVLLASLLMALAVYFGPALRLQARHELLLSSLRDATPLALLPLQERHAGDDLHGAIHTLATLQQRNQKAQQAVQDYAAEIKAVDFDQKMLAAIESIELAAIKNGVTQ